MKRLPLLLFLTFLSVLSYGQSDNVIWLPSSPIYPTLEYDLLEAQVYSGIFNMKTEKNDFSSAYIPVNLGFVKSFLQWQWSGIDLGFAMGVGSFTQFEVERYDKNTLRGGLLNIDYKASGLLYAKKGKHRFRMQLFHMSSHLGDDYMIRNEHFIGNDKSRSYEELNLIYYLELNKVGIYLGAGEVISPHVFRKRFMVSGGFQGHIPIKSNMDITFGTDVKVYEENSYEPDIHSGLGLKFSKKGLKHFSITIDAYHGYLPYSTLDYGKVSWIGLSAAIWP